MSGTVYLNNPLGNQCHSVALHNYLVKSFQSVDFFFFLIYINQDSGVFPGKNKGSCSSTVRFSILL